MKKKKSNTLKRNIHAIHPIMQKGGTHGKTTKAIRKGDKVNLIKDLSKTDN